MKDLIILNPTENQKVLINSIFGYCNFIYNTWLLNRLPLFRMFPCEDYASSKQLILQNVNLESLKARNKILNKTSEFALESSFKEAQNDFLSFIDSFEEIEDKPPLRSNKNPNQHYYENPNLVSFSTQIELPIVGKISHKNELKNYKNLKKVNLIKSQKEYFLEIDYQGE